MGDSTVRDALLSVERQTQKTPPALFPKPFPPELAHVWEWFNELAIARLTGRKPRPEEVKMLSMLDFTWRVVHGEAADARQKWREAQARAKSGHGR
jgi:hypothetical protein